MTMTEGTPHPTPGCRRCRGGKEFFRYWDNCYEFDVDRARELVQDGRDPVEVEEESVQASVDECRIDEAHVSHVDPSFPGLIAHIRYQDADGVVYKGHVLIDGHHRAARCLRERRPFAAYLLTEEESLAILLRSPGAPGLVPSATGGSLV